MNEAYGYGDTGRHVFDSRLLEETAAKFREQPPSVLLDKLLGALMPAGSVGKIDGGSAAYTRLKQVYDAMSAELERAGIDILDLASRTLAAGDLAKQADTETMAAARSGAK